MNIAVKLSLCVGLIALLARVAVAQKADAADVKNEDPRIQHYVQMMQGQLWKELDFVRQICTLSPEQRPQVKAAADSAVKEAAKSLLQPQGRATPASVSVKLRKSIRDVLEKALTPEQFEAYRVEADKRAAAYKEATILAAVSKLDASLFLTQEQREKIVESLTAAWQPDWEQWLMVAQYANQYLPQVPDEPVVKHLTVEQREVWQNLQKINIHHWGGQARRPNDEAWWSGKENAAAEPKANRPGQFIEEAFFP
jgi:hypothetical protein